MTIKDDKGDQPSGGETTWTNTGETRYGRGQHKTRSFGDDMLRPSPNHGTQRLPNGKEYNRDIMMNDDVYIIMICIWLKAIIVFILNWKCQFNLIIPNVKLFI